MVDLGRWLGEEYRAPVTEHEPESQVDDDAHER
jgi:endogenous inhibitor of DNA gyrase (YacG/DUF329 family)